MLLDRLLRALDAGSQPELDAPLAQALRAVLREDGLDPSFRPCC